MEFALAKILLETKVPDHMSAAVPLSASNNNDKEQPHHVKEAFEGSFIQTTNFRS